MAEANFRYCSIFPSSSPHLSHMAAPPTATGRIAFQINTREAKGFQELQLETAYCGAPVPASSGGVAEMTPPLAFAAACVQARAISRNVFRSASLFASRAQLMHSLAKR
jgi:hypothetical protein